VKAISTDALAILIAQRLEKRGSYVRNRRDETSDRLSDSSRSVTQESWRWIAGEKGRPNSAPPAFQLAAAGRYSWWLLHIDERHRIVRILEIRPPVV
jgi:hypothetical protein